MNLKVNSGGDSQQVKKSLQHGTGNRLDVDLLAPGLSGKRGNSDDGILRTKPKNACLTFLYDDDFYRVSA